MTGGVVLPAAPGRPTVLLLHGRSADERQLLPLVRAAAGRGVGVLAPRGPVAIGDGYAWCRRHAEGMPVSQSLAATGESLGDWVDRALERQRLVGPVFAVGYSNGAMAALVLAAARPDLVRRVALLRGAYPLPAALVPSLAGVTVLAVGGAADRRLPPSVHRLAVRDYEAAGAHVETRVLFGAGHELRPQDARELRRFLGAGPAAFRPAPAVLPPFPSRIAVAALAP